MKFLSQPSFSLNFQAISFKVLFYTEDVLVPLDLPKVPEIGTAVEVLLYTGLEFDYSKVVQAKLELPKSWLIPHL